MPAKHLLVVILLVHIITIEFKHSFPYIETLYVVQQISVTVVLKTMQDLENLHYLSHETSFFRDWSYSLK